MSPNMRKSLILLLCSTSCGLGEHREFRVEEALQEYYGYFINEAHTRELLPDVNDLIIEFSGNLGEGANNGVTLGQCITSDNSTPTVKIDKTLFYNLGSCQKWMLIFHELGHCLLNRHHKDDYDSDGKRISLMSTFLISELDCNAKHASYINELFAN